MVILMNEEKKYTYQEDVQVEIDKMMKKRELIIANAPTFYLEIDRAPYILPRLFNSDGTPNGNFVVPEKYQKRARFALQKSHLSSDKTWYGKNINDEYLIMVTPEFLSEEELDELQQKHYIMKKLGNTEVKLKNSKIGMERTNGKWQMSYTGTLSDLDRKKIREARELLQSCSLVVEEFRKIQSKLPHAPREVIIGEDNISNRHK